MSDSRRDFESVKTILTIWGFGLIFTLVSGLYVERPMVLDGEIIYCGFPFRWLEISRSTWFPNSPWHYNFLWFWFVIDLSLYVILVLATTAIYDKTLRDVNKPRLYKTFFLAISIGFVILYQVPSLLSQITYALGIWSYTFPQFWRYLFGELTVVYAWSLKKYRETTREHRNAILMVAIAILAIFLLDNIVDFHLLLSR